jgi:hypothetical protein
MAFYGERPGLRVGGFCIAMFAYDVGLSIDLNKAEADLPAMTQRGRLRHRHRAPDYFEYRPAPVRVVQDLDPFKIGGTFAATRMELVLFDFGAVSVAYTVPFNGPFDVTLELSQLLYDNIPLLEDSRRRVRELVAALGESIDRPCLAEQMEDFLVFHLTTPDGKDAIFSRGAEPIAKLLRSESSALSAEEVEDAVSCRLSFGPDDLAVIDWNAAVLIGTEMEDVVSVLEFVNVELLEMRYLDQQLDDALDQAYEVLSRRRAGRFAGSRTLERDMEQVAALQVEGAILFERVSNAVKLLGDQYLARVYRMASQRFHLEAWDAGIHRKLQTLDSIYGKLSDRATTRRMEVLEWIIIVLIAVSIAISFLPAH